MWALMATGYFLAAILLNAVVARWVPLPVFASFVASGLIVGLALIVHALLVFDAAIFVLAAVLSYAAACELFLIVMTMLLSSIAVRTIRYVGAKPITATALAEMYNEHNMVTLRLERIAAAKLAEKDQDFWRLTRRGRLFLTVLSLLRAVFGHGGHM